MLDFHGKLEILTALYSRANRGGRVKRGGNVSRVKFGIYARYPRYLFRSAWVGSAERNVPPKAFGRPTSSMFTSSFPLLQKCPNYFGKIELSLGLL